MDVKYVNPFAEAFSAVMPQLGFSNIQKGNLSLKDRDLTSSGVIMVVGIVGEIKGNVVYCLDLENAKLKGHFVTNGNYVTGNWKVSLDELVQEVSLNSPLGRAIYLQKIGSIVSYSVNDQEIHIKILDK